MEKAEGCRKQGQDLDAFLSIEVDFDEVSSSLTRVGIKRGHLLDEKDWAQPDTPLIATQEMVVDIESFRVKEKMPEKFTWKWMKTLCPDHLSSSDAAMKKTVKKLMEGYKGLVKRKKEHPDKLATFLSAPLKTDSQQPQSLVSSSAATSAPSSEDLTRQLKELQKENDRLSKEVKKYQQQNSVFQEKNVELQQTVAVLQETCAELSVEKNRLIGELGIKTEVLKEKMDELQRKNKEVNELSDQVQGSQRKIGEQQKEIRALNPARVYSLEKTLSSVRYHRRRLETKLAVTEAHLIEVKKSRAVAQVSLSRSRKRVGDCELEKEKLEDELEQLRQQRSKPKTKAEKNRYHDDVRKTIFTLQSEGNVPASKCTFAIKTVAKHLFNTHFDDKDLPCLQSALNIVGEAHVVTKIQAGEKILEADNFTIHTDGTSRGGQKIVGHQMTLDTGERLSLGMVTVAKEDSATLLEITVSLLQEIQQLYSGWRNTEEDGNEVFRQMLSRLTSVMTDRAALNKKFDKELKKFLITELGTEICFHFLHCNAHFLLGLSRVCDESLKRIEKSEGRKLGRDAFPEFSNYQKTETATTRVLRLTCDLMGPRGDEKSGCRAEWVGFCEEKKVRSQMTSYRSNRFNCFFQSAAAILHHLQDLLCFLQDGYLPHPNRKIRSVAADIKDETLLSFVCAVAILYFQVTGPFWKLLESNVKYLEFYKYIQEMESAFLQWQEDASDLLDPNWPGLFGRKFQLTSEMRQSTFQFAASYPKVKSSLELLMKDLLAVTRLQLADFLQGGKYAKDQPPEVEKALSHCPLTNLLGENVFGELDFDMNKRRHATFFHRSSLQMTRYNKMPDWLAKKSVEEQASLLKTGRREAANLRKKYREQELRVKLNVRRRLLENQRQQAEKVAKAAARRAALIRQVLAHGGPCQKQQDVAKLIRRHRKAGASIARLKQYLKDEIRFQKTVVVKKGTLKLAGSLQELKRALEQHLPKERADPDVASLVSSAADDLPAPDPLSATSDSPAPDPLSAASDSPASDPSAVDSDGTPFQFSNQGQWVAVYWSDRFYIGQVIKVTDRDSGKVADVQYLEQCSGSRDRFRWPVREEVVEDTLPEDVFYWDFECLPVSNDFRVWKVEQVEEISAAYERMAASLKDM